MNTKEVIEGLSANSQAVSDAIYHIKLLDDAVTEADSRSARLLDALQDLELYARDLLIVIDGGEREVSKRLPSEILDAQKVIENKGNSHE